MKKDWKNKNKENFIVDDPNPFLKKLGKKSSQKKGRLKSKFDKLDFSKIRN